MKKAIALACAVTLGGCTQFQSTVDYLASPTFTQATTNVKNVAMAFDCGLVVTTAALSNQIAGIVAQGKAAVSTTGKIYAVAAAVCTALGGIPTALPTGSTVQVVTK